MGFLALPAHMTDPTRTSLRYGRLRSTRAGLTPPPLRFLVRALLHLQDAISPNKVFSNFV
jgi:hypothetical protein